MALAKRLPIPQVTVPPSSALRGNPPVVGECQVALAFAEDRLRACPGNRLTAREMFQAFLAWCDDAEQPEMTQTAFGRKLAEMGWDKRRTRGRVYYRDVALVDVTQADDGEDIRAEPWGEPQLTAQKET